MKMSFRSNIVGTVLDLEDTEFSVRRSMPGGCSEMIMCVL